MDEFLKVLRFINGSVTLEMFGNMVDHANDLDSGKLALNSDVIKLYMLFMEVDRTTSYDATLRWYNAQTGNVSDR